MKPKPAKPAQFIMTANIVLYAHLACSWMQHSLMKEFKCERYTNKTSKFKFINNILSDLQCQDKQ
jgi:hypothetical protein